MAHPIMFQEDDSLLARVRAIAMALPEADEKISHGRPTFFTQKVFCYFGGSVRSDGDWIAHDAAIMVRPDPDDDPALRQDPRFWVPAYLGPSGWLGIDLADTEGADTECADTEGADTEGADNEGADTDWQEIAELIDASYRVTAPRRLVRELDAR